MAPRKPTRKNIREAQQRESRTLGLAAQRQAAVRRQAVLSYNFSDVITSQTYLNLYGMVGDNVKVTREFTQDNGTTQFNVDDNEWIAQVFTVGATDLYVITAQVFIDDSGSSGEFTLEIQETTAGEPNGITLDLATIADPPATAAWVIHTFDKVRLKAGVSYALVCKGEENLKPTDVWYANSGESGNVFTTSDSGGNWTEDANGALRFRINATVGNPFIMFPASGITSAYATHNTSPIAVAEDDLLVDLDFDFEVQKTIALKGLALLQISSTGGFDTINLIKYDGTTETIIATATTSSSNLVRLNITSVQNIPRGNILRLNIQQKAIGAGATALSIGTSGSNLILSLPVKLIGEI